MSRLNVARALFALTLAAPMIGAQVTTPTNASSRDTAAVVAASDGIPRPANDSLFRRARRLVSEGNGTAGRALVDSLLAAADPATSAYGDALYWHGALASTAAAAEQDYRRVIVEYPLAYYSGDALLAIAELEQARGDRVGAMQHLQRFVREHPENPGRGAAALGVARLAFEQQDSTLACSMLVVARRSCRRPTSRCETRSRTSATGVRAGNGQHGDEHGDEPDSEPIGDACGTSSPTTSAPSSAPAAASVATRAPEATRRQPVKPAKARAREMTRTRPPRPRRPRSERRPQRHTADAHRSTHQTRTESHGATRYTVQVAAYDTRPRRRRS